MRREFLLNITFLVAVNLIIKPAYIFGIDLEVQNRVGPGAYGLFAALFSLSYILQIVNDAGIQQSNNRAIAGDRALLTQRYPALAGVKTWLAIVYLGACALAALALGYDTEVWPLLQHIALNQVLLSWLQFLRSNVSGLGMYRRDSLLSVMDKLWMILLCGALLYLPALRERFTLQDFVWAQTASLALTIVHARYYLAGRGLRWLGFPSLQTMLPLLRHSLPYALVVLLMTSYNRLDTVMLERLLPDGETQAGIYQMAFRLLDALNNFAFLFGALLLPMLANLLARGADPSPLVSLGARLLLAGSVASAAALSKFAPELIGALYDRPETEAVEALRLLAWVFVPVCLMYVYSTLLTADGRLREMNLVLGATALANLILLAVLVPAQGIQGAALASLVTQGGVSLAMMVLCHYRMGLTWSWSEHGRMAAFLAAGILVSLYLPAPSSLPWWQGMVFIFLAIGSLAASFGLLPLRPFLALLRSRLSA